LTLAAAAPPAEGADASPLAPLDFLLGAWEASGGGAPGSGAGTTTFERRVGNKLIVRTNHADYPATKDRPASSHDDLMVIYASPDGEMHADYYDNEGHVIRYSVDAKDGTAVFTSDPSPGVPRFRLTYKPAYAGIVGGEFEIASPGEPEAFKSYLTWTMKHPAAKAK
jgi:hypothetical protein